MQIVRFIGLDEKEAHFGYFDNVDYLVHCGCGCDTTYSFDEVKIIDSYTPPEDELAEIMGWPHTQAVESDDADYEVGYDPYLGCFSDDV